MTYIRNRGTSVVLGSTIWIIQLILILNKNFVGCGVLLRDETFMAVCGCERLLARELFSSLGKRGQGLSPAKAAISRFESQLF